MGAGASTENPLGDINTLPAKISEDKGKQLAGTAWTDAKWNQLAEDGYVTRDKFVAAANMAKMMGTDLSPQKRLPPKEIARSPSFVKKEGQASFAGHDVRGQLQAQLAEMAKTEGGSVDLRAVFNKWDADGNGTLDRQEFEWMLDALTIYLSEEALIGLFAMLDTDGSGDVDFEEFSDFMKSVDGSGEPEVAVEPTEPAIAEDAEGEAEEAAVEAAAGEATEAAAPAAEGTAVAAAEEEER